MRTLSVLVAAALLLVGSPAAGQQLTKVSSFGSNPGALEMFEYVPAAMPASAPLVIAMHGCSQQASGMPAAGWTALADKYKFYLLLPQQTSANNPVQCFNWAGEYGDPANLIRGQGENLSIKQMVDKMKASYSIDATRVFVTGFSSGGGMAAVMMATWPEVFAGGAIMSGVPYRCATTVQGAYDCMAMNSKPATKKEPEAWGDLVRAAAPDHDGPWPRVIIFHGTSDTTVATDNQGELVEQWTNVHGAALGAASTDAIAGHERRRWAVAGTTVVESWKIGGMAHAVAIGDDPEERCGTAGAFVASKGVCAAYRSLKFFGVAGDEEDPPPGGGDNPDPGGAPTVAIVSPADGGEVSGSVTIEVDASDDGAISRVEFLVDGMLRGSDATAPYTHGWQTANYSAGSHTITAVAYDDFDNSTEVSVTVSVVRGGAGGIDVVDPISWGCAVGPRAAGGVWLVALAVAVGLRRRRRDDFAPARRGRK
jgi:poly(hydroxyalkanoate) depolymerase family esterase